MAKGTYYLNENQYHLRKRDNSFQSCVCILLIFVAICVLITLLGTNLRNDGSDKIEVVSFLYYTGLHYNNMFFAEKLLKKNILQ